MICKKLQVKHIYLLTDDLSEVVNVQNVRNSYACLCIREENVEIATYVYVSEPKMLEISM